MNKENLITIEDKATYLAFCAEWKAEYKALSQKIRKEKHDFKQAQRDNTYQEGERLRRSLAKLKEEANTLLSLRAESKVVTNTNYAAAHLPAMA